MIQFQLRYQYQAQKVHHFPSQVVIPLQIQPQNHLILIRIQIRHQNQAPNQLQFRLRTQYLILFRLQNLDEIQVPTQAQRVAQFQILPQYLIQREIHKVILSQFQVLPLTLFQLQFLTQAQNLDEIQTPSQAPKAAQPQNQFLNLIQNVFRQAILALTQAPIRLQFQLPSHSRLLNRGVSQARLQLQKALHQATHHHFQNQATIHLLNLTLYLDQLQRHNQ